jgi:hypothetical protein
VRVHHIDVIPDRLGRDAARHVPMSDALQHDFARGQSLRTWCRIPIRRLLRVGASARDSRTCGHQHFWLQLANLCVHGLKPKGFVRWAMASQKCLQDGVCDEGTRVQISGTLQR